MSKHWRYLLPLAWPLLAVNVIIAALYAVIVCRAHSWSFRNGVLTFIAGTKVAADGGPVTRLLFRPGAQGWSPIVGFASEWHRQRDDLRAHENVHVWQESMFALGGAVIGVGLFALGQPTSALVATFLGGPAFMLAYGAAFLVKYVPHVAGVYRKLRVAAVARWASLKAALTDWQPPYRASPFERMAYARQDAFLGMSPQRRAEVWT